MSLISFFQDPHEEVVRKYPFDTELYLDDLTDCAEVTYITSYTVTGAFMKRRQNRDPVAKQVVVNGKQILLWRFRDQVYATSPNCPHQGLPLGLGDLEDLKGDGRNLCITCPHHKWKFDPASGTCRNHFDNNETVLTTYEAFVDEAKRIFVMFPSFDQSLFSSQDSHEDF